MGCKICWEEIGQNESVVLECGHNLCANCLTKIIEVNIRGYSTYNIRCPEIKCAKPISNQLVKQILVESKLEKLAKKFEKIEIDHLLIKNPSLQICIDDNCRELIHKRTAKDNGFVSCPKCLSNFCVNCRLKSHGEQICPVSSLPTLDALRKTKAIMSCPKCKVDIQKVDGCNVMKCPFCRDQFCWICGKMRTAWHYNSLNLFGCPGMELKTRSLLLMKAKSVFLLLVLCGLLFSLIFVGAYFWEITVFLLKVLFADFVIAYAERYRSFKFKGSSYWLLHLNAAYFMGDFSEIVRKCWIVICFFVFAIVFAFLRKRKIN